jgi:hypothetical protein
VDEFEKVKYQAEVDDWKAQRQQGRDNTAAEQKLDDARDDSRVQAERDSVKAVHDAYIATTQSSLDRAMTRMNVVTSSVSAVTTVYTGLLALVYAAEPGKGEHLQAGALIPALFLGLALLLVTIYAAMFRRKTINADLLPSGVGGYAAEYRLVTFMEWCLAGVLARSWALHAGIVSFGLGIATLPLPFLKIKGWVELVILVCGLAVVVLAALLSLGLWYESKLLRNLRKTFGELEQKRREVGTPTPPALRP